ncbi:putative pentatricopeptide repeat-containing protein At5g37570 isoform X3 [Magnolia sinica]|uniref:putative pentatricopeptide repeat-containing protein At5g37570 isoform X3 n=1 Tax=Magnolia sinica TaxID=86752 RepID=UPI0026583826|nr:putative pentatricopeptide repeat-containing protein At5g37570 isoform X3 [Magnolia sinica]
MFLWNAAKHRYPAFPHKTNSVGSYGYLLERCTSLVQLNQIHAQMLVNGFHRDNWLLTKLINALMSIAEQKLACAVFHHVDSPDEFLWNWMIRSYSCHGPVREAIVFYDMMRRRCVRPNNFSFPFALKSCAAVEALSEGEQMHADIVKLGFVCDVFVQTALVDMYAKCSRIEMARRVFDGMGEKSVVSWTAIVAGYCRHGLLEQAQELFDEMPVRNAVAWNVMIDGLARFGDLEVARHVFDRMSQRNTVSWTIMIGGYLRVGDMVRARRLFDQMVGKEVVAWTAMISGYAQNGESGEAIKLFHMMLADDVKPDEVTMLGVISAGVQSASLHLCTWIEECINRCGFGSDVRVLNAAINMYVQCGSIDQAFHVFEKMPERDVVSYNSMIAGCATHGDMKGALSVFSMMIEAKVLPNSITFIGILTACAHGGLVDEGRTYFRMMLDLSHVKITVEHYACMVDLLGRAGHLDEAHELILNMPIEPKASTWGALLGACRIHGNLGLAEVVAQKLFEMEPENPGNYTILANMYTEGRMWDAAGWVRRLMKDRQVSKTTGSSWIEVANSIENTTEARDNGRWKLPGPTMRGAALHGRLGPP